MNRLRQRIRRLEPPKPPTARMPHVLSVRSWTGEAVEQATERFAEQWGPIPKHHLFLVVPEQPTNPEGRAIVKRQTEQRQARLIANAKSVSAGIMEDQNNEAR